MYFYPVLSLPESDFFYFFFMAKHCALKVAKRFRASEILSISSHTLIKHGTKQVNLKSKRGNSFSNSDGSSSTLMCQLIILG